MLTHAVNNTVWVLATWVQIGTRLPRAVHAASLVVYAVMIVLAVRWLARRTHGGGGERPAAQVAVG
jgi:hypothetical protein